MISFLFFIPVIECKQRKTNRDRTRYKLCEDEDQGYTGLLRHIKA